MIEQIKIKIKKGFYEYSMHATNQSIIRHIAESEVKESFFSGKIIEDYPEDKYGPSCLILGFTKNNRPLHIQCTYPSRPLIKIITLYEPNKNLWINFRRRKK